MFSWASQQLNAIGVDTTSLDNLVSYRNMDIIWIKYRHNTTLPPCLPFTSCHLFNIYNPIIYIFLYINRYIL